MYIYVYGYVCLAEFDSYIATNVCKYTHIYIYICICVYVPCSIDYIVTMANQSL